MSPDPFNPSEQEAKDEIEGSQAEGVAAPLRLEACGLPPANDDYAAFWHAWGRRVTVADTERLIASKVEEGAALTDIIAGVLRFRKYCADTGKSPRMKPAAFVHGEKWRDDWQLYPAEAAKSKSGTCRKEKIKKGGQGQGKNPWKYNPEWDAWSDKKYDYIRNLLKIHSQEFENGYPKAEAELDRMREIIKPWHLENPEPPLWKNTVTGETWGAIGDKLPAPDWSAAEQRLS